MTKLKKLRMERHLTQNELAKKTGITPSNISRLESGSKKIGQVALATAVRLGDALGVTDLRELIDEED